MRTIRITVTALAMSLTIALGTPALATDGGASLYVPGLRGPMAGIVPPPGLVADVDPRIAGDLVALSRAFLETAGGIVTATDVIAGGSPIGATEVGGADFDFVTDGTIYEVKTTTNPGRVAIEALRQLIGYLLLDWDDAFKIRRLGLILPRQRTKLVYNVAELLGGKDLAAMRERMRLLVSDEAKPAGE